MFKTIKIVIFIILCSISFSSSVLAENILSPQFAVGQYQDRSSDHIFPWIITSTDQGKTWSYFYDRPDKLLKFGVFSSLSCHNNFCMAIGNYDFEYPISTKDQYPLVALSNTEGKTWEYLSFSRSGLHKGTIPFHLKCNSEFCTMVGIDQNSVRMPMVAISQNNGNTWSYPIIKNLPLDYDYSTGYLDQVDCSSQVCVAIGAYQNQTKPLLATGTKDLNQWSYRKIPFPLNLFHSKLWKVQCNEQFCAAVGFYSIGSKQFPLFLKSTDQGKSWSAIHLQSDVLGLFNNIHCQGSQCLASGYFQIQKKVYYLAISQNGGLTWEYPSLKTMRGNLSNANLYIVTSSENSFITAGYTRDAGPRPVLFISKDQGKNWTNIPSIISADLEDGILSDINCKNHVCLATGGYRSKISFNSPFLAMSYNDGQDWNFPSSVLSKLPEDYFMNGRLGQCHA